MAPPIDAIALYNSWQTPFAVIIILLIAVSHYLSYGKTDLKKFLKQISLSLIISGLVSLVMASSVNMWHPLYFILLWATLFAAIANFEFWRKILNGKWNVSGSSIAHIGFALVIMGALMSNANKNIISNNKSYIAKDFPSNENILLEKGDTIVFRLDVLHAGAENYTERDNIRLHTFFRVLSWNVNWCTEFNNKRIEWVPKPKVTCNEETNTFQLKIADE